MWRVVSRLPTAGVASRPAPDRVPGFVRGRIAPRGAHRPALEPRVVDPRRRVGRGHRVRYRLPAGAGSPGPLDRLDRVVRRSPGIRRLHAAPTRPGPGPAQRPADLLRPRHSHRKSLGSHRPWRGHLRRRALPDLGLRSRARRLLETSAVSPKTRTGRSGFPAIPGPPDAARADSPAGRTGSGANSEPTTDCPATTW